MLSFSALWQFAFKSKINCLAWVSVCWPHGTQGRSITCNYRVGLVLMRPLCFFFQFEGSFTFSQQRCDRLFGPTVTGIVCLRCLSLRLLSLARISISNAELITSKEYMHLLFRRAACFPLSPYPSAKSQAIVHLPPHCPQVPHILSS